MSRELDALVAEKVMDEQKLLVPDDGSIYPDPRYTSWWWGRDIHELVPHYSTDIAAAWLVVEKLAPNMDFYMEIATKDDGWFVMFGDDLDKACIADTAPLAICRAALKVVEND
jgi:hypothetical protein